MKFTAKLSKRSRRGLVVLLFIMTAVTISPRIIRAWQPQRNLQVTYTDYQQTVDELKQSAETAPTKRKRNWQKQPRRYHSPKHRFDPNTLSASDWEQFGLSPKQAAGVARYCKRTIYSNEELQQIYVLPAEVFELIKDSTFYPERPTSKNPDRSTKKPGPDRVALSLDVNSATEEELLELRGIGPFYARKIVEYRNELGGYVSKEQLLEIWKFDVEKLESIREDIIIDTEKIQLLNINTATVEELQKHPYISWNVANSIVKMRNRIQKYPNFEALLESELIDENLLRKLQPYLTL